MQINLLSNQNSLLHQFIAELRDIEVQKDRMRFRKNIERIGQLMAYEVSKVLAWEEQSIQTPLGRHQSKVLAEQPVLATILRAGLSMHQGVLDCCDKAIAHLFLPTENIMIIIHLILWLSTWLVLLFKIVLYCLLILCWPPDNLLS